MSESRDLQNHLEILMEKKTKALNELELINNFINIKKTQITDLQKKITTVCQTIGHDYVREVDSGPYPETWYVCKRCQTIQ